ncbi:BT_3928 family protein [Halpernia sp.]|uniref:BT_3928 family protein n=1 Tax=Halpernia sp. TaxID=2782209 RepID=UPI003A8CEE6C
MFKNILRIIVGLIFIASGFVKAVDVVGFSFKLEEYFAPSVFNIPFLEKFSLALAIFVVVLELILGLLLVLKISLKWTLNFLILLCIFFAFLTFYSAYFKVVTDCGCFGDAIKFTPWQSFGKDIILLCALLVLYFLYRKNFNDTTIKTLKWTSFGSLSFLFAVIIYFGVKHEPIIDFRDYKIGTDLKAEKAKIVADPAEFKTFYSLKNKKTGEILKVNQDDYISKNYWQNPDWEIEKEKTSSEIVKQGYDSEIAKFKIENETGNDISDEILNAPKAILIFSYNPDEMKTSNLEAAIQKISLNKDALIYGISTKPNTFKNIKNGLMDGTAIKTIARSNPFILTLQNGKIIGKSSVEDYLNKN